MKASIKRICSCLIEICTFVKYVTSNENALFFRYKLTLQLVGREGGAGGGAAGAVTWSKCGRGVRASISKPTPFIYLAFEKQNKKKKKNKKKQQQQKTFIYLIVQNVDPFIYCPLTFIPIYCW